MSRIEKQLEEIEFTLVEGEYILPRELLKSILSATYLAGKCEGVNEAIKIVKK